VLKQSGSGTFPWCVKNGVAITDGFAEVKFKPVAGREDQAGGIVWRWKDRDNYYIARANALKYVDAPVAAQRWHTLRAEFKDQHIKVLLDGKSYIEIDDGHISGAGSVGVWTKADSVTVFDDFSYGGT
jgi:hypothetical protein